ncbi:MAG: helix-turn-helix domain-containing protein, partial [Candidatus Nanohaloarchaea archaeon]|nr:helix-turn-helix domain-containing protein [Candidatus Nanohaloarchaea archaeon]
MFELLNQHTAKVFLAGEEGDSIRSIARKAGTSYGWAYKWVKRLEEFNIVGLEEGFKVKDEEIAEKFESLAQALVSRKLELKDAYLLPNFSGLKYAYCKTDAVFVWTKGGYQIGRSKKEYPIFIQILEDDLEEWKEFFQRFSVEFNIGERGGTGIYFVLYPVDSFETEWVENAQVVPLEDTMDWAEKYKYNFQPAIEML